MKDLLAQPIHWLDHVRAADFLAPLLVRAYMVPVLWSAGMSKLTHYAGTVQWFGSKDWGLGLPLPDFLVNLVAATELTGAVCLALGLGTRVVTIPLMITMLVAAFSVHLKNGWYAIAPGDSPAALNLRAALSDLQVTNPELYALMVEHGRPVVFNNGVETIAVYFIMLLVLFFFGAGRWVSADYWLRHHWLSD